MSPEEKSYIAGIIDGEGSIMLTRFHKNQSYAPCISIASTSYELLTWLLNKIGSGVIKAKKNYQPDKHQDSYTYTLKYNAAISLLQVIHPYLVIQSKKMRAMMIIEEYKHITPRNGKYSPELLQLKQDFYKRFMTS